MQQHFIRAGIAAMLFLLGQQSAFATELAEPQVFASDPASKTLDLLMIAKPARITAFPKVTGWVYEICERKFSKDDRCLPEFTNTNPYGGARLQLQQGDTLNIRLVNRLPAITDLDGIAGNRPFLLQNPTNLHTHGMLVSPGQPAKNATNPVFGDSVFVLTFNPQNGVPDLRPGGHVHGAINIHSTDYRYTIPAHHPSGLFWIHPHAHGISLSQIHAGMSGIVTVGRVSDYINGLPGDMPIRHLILKDLQVNREQIVNRNYDPDFCDRASAEPGVCRNAHGGAWYFTVNGQRNPHISVAARGEIWRITNSSASVTYELQLAETDEDDVIPLQLLSVDGVSITSTPGFATEKGSSIGAAGFETLPCPGGKTKQPGIVCINKLRMLPSSRAEIWVADRDDESELKKANITQAVLKTLGYRTGPAGDAWPAVDLAQVSLQSVSKNIADIAITNTSIVDFGRIAGDPAIANTATEKPPAACNPLPSGWKRRIYFGNPTPDDFGLGYELLDGNGAAVPGSFVDVNAYNGSAPDICIPLPSDAPAQETWELVNLSAEDHNFHIHQTKFKVLATGISGNGTTAIWQDNVPLPAGNAGCDGTYANWKAGNCRTNPVTVGIPFAIAGDFVYHCHILEHEDGGMMAVIHVVKQPPAERTAFR